MCQYRRSAKIDPSPSPLECAHMRFDKKYVLSVRVDKIDRKLKFDPSKMNDFL